MLKVRSFLFSQIRAVTCSWKRKPIQSGISTMDRNEAYFLYQPGDASFYLTFYHQLEGRKERQYNFNRKPSETIEELLHRIQAKIDVVDKKKKGKKKSEAQTTETERDEKINLEILVKDDPVTRDSEFVKTVMENVDNRIYLKIGSTNYLMVVNSPWISNLCLPSTILAGFPVHATKIEGLFFSKENSTFRWFTETKANTWEQVGQSYTYFPSNNDIGKRLKLTCTPGNVETNGPDVDAITKNQIEAGPGSCPFEKRHAFTKEKAVGKNFRVMSYNILADIYCDSDFTRTTLFPYCPPYALKIEYRQLLLFKEILGYNSDIICLQEVDTKVFKDYLTPELSDYGYEGIFTKKGGQVSEGLAIFFNSHRFRQVDLFESVISKDLSVSPVFKEIWEKVQHNEAFVKRISDRSNVVQAVALESTENNEYLLIGNTHLYFHPDADHVRLVQGALIIYWLNDILASLREKHPSKKVSLILCGDFNTVVSCGIYQLYTIGTVTDEIEDWTSNKEEALSNVTISQPTILSSGCGTPQFTNFTVGFAECIDYIFYEKDKLEVSQVIPFPSEEELRANTALPSIVFPSDHIALVADLSFKT